MPASVKEDQEFVPGGDIRTRGNSWLRKAFDEAQLPRVLREGEVRRVIHQISNVHGLCILAHHYSMHMIVLFLYGHRVRSVWYFLRPLHSQR